VGHTSSQTTFAILADIAQQADELLVGSGESLDVIPLVVGVAAWECLATRDRQVFVLWEQHLDAIGIVWVDNGRDIEKGHATPSIPADFAEHTRDIFCIFGDRVEVTDPSTVKLGNGSCMAFEDEVLRAGHVLLPSEDDGAGGAVLVDEMDRVGGCHGCERGGCKKDSVDELHLVCFGVDKQRVLEGLLV
jgi:hypothetical protein